eukprot:g81919.t1
MQRLQQGMVQIWSEPKVLEVPSFKSEFRVQLIPSLPSGTDSSVHAILQQGPYRSWWLRVRSWPGYEEKSALMANPMHCVHILTGLLERLEKKGKGAVYVCVPDELIVQGVAALLKARGYRFYTHIAETGELVYYRWQGKGHDMVPHFATSIEGGGLVLLSQDESKVLVVMEHDRWTFPGGATGLNETTFETAEREAFEEAGVRLDQKAKVWLVGGWNVAGSRERVINDHYLIYIGKAASEDIRVDGREIKEAKWIEVSQLLEALDQGKPHPEVPRSIEFRGVVYARSLLHAVRRWHQGKAFELVRTSDWKRQKPGLEFH